MSSELEDVEPESQPGLQESAPAAPNAQTGPRVGRDGGASPGPPTDPSSAPVANVGQRRAQAPGPPPSRTPWLSPEDGPLIQSELTPIRLCPHCGMAVPLDALSCTRCGRWAPANKGARRRLRKSDVELLHQEVLTDYAPQTAMERHACQNLAESLAELKAVRPGTPAHQRILAAIQSIRATLDGARASRDSESSSLHGASQMPSSALEAARDLLARCTEGEVLSEFDQGRLAVLRAALHGKLELPPDPPAAAALTPDSFNGSPIPARSDACHAVRELGDPGNEEQEPTRAADRCGWCGDVASRCAEIRDDIRWLTEHQERPDVTAHLAAQAALRSRLGWDARTGRDPFSSGSRTVDDNPTDVMLRQIGRGLPDWYRR